MHFASLILVLTAATAASAAALAKRSFYFYTFGPLHAAINAPVGDYLTYTLVANEFDCFSACDGVSGCKFVNIYHDNDASSKKCSPLLTCSMFNACIPASFATNTGGQKSDCAPGNNFITSSYGFCKL